MYEINIMKKLIVLLLFSLTSYLYGPHYSGYGGYSAWMPSEMLEDSVVTWGEVGFGGDSSSVNFSDVAAIYSSGGAFAAIKNDGSVVTWGSSTDGGDSSSVQSQLTNVTAIYSTFYAFAAVKGDGSVVTWGNSNYGADSSSVQRQLTNVAEIYSTR